MKRGEINGSVLAFRRANGESGETLLWKNWSGWEWDPTKGVISGASTDTSEENDEQLWRRYAWRQQARVTWETLTKKEKEKILKA